MDAAFPSITAPRLVVSGLSGGGGKTLLSLGLARALTLRGLRVKPCKKGHNLFRRGDAGTRLDTIQVP